MSSQDQIKAFYAIADFPDLVRVQKNYQVILDELKNNKIWLNWGSDSYDPMGHCQFLSGNWTVCPVFFGNYPPLAIKAPGIAPQFILSLPKILPARFPRTTELLKTVPILNFAGFSRLHPKSSLAPHRHRNPKSLICHLGLVIPPGNSCGLMVDGKTHLWSQPGDMVIFDDNLEHSAWNNSDEERIVLYMDVVRPVA